jgi:hypothetical protein
MSKASTNRVSRQLVYARDFANGVNLELLALCRSNVPAHRRDDQERPVQRHSQAPFHSPCSWPLQSCERHALQLLRNVGCVVVGHPANEIDYATQALVEAPI